MTTMTLSQPSNEILYPKPKKQITAILPEMPDMDSEEALETLYEFEDKLEALEVELSTYYDGIGHYEFWGQKCFDKGEKVSEILNSEEISFSLGILNATSKQLLQVFDEFYLESMRNSQGNIRTTIEDDNGGYLEPTLRIDNLRIENGLLKCEMSWEED